MSVLVSSEFKPEIDPRVQARTGNWFFAFPDDPEVLVKGDLSSPSQAHIDRASIVLSNVEQLKSRAIRLLEEFMKDKGSWYLSIVDCGAKTEALQCDFILTFAFEADRDPHEYGYTYFDVCFVKPERPHPVDQHGRPVKFVVGFY